jgi:hypothetical protein
MEEYDKDLWTCVECLLSVDPTWEVFKGPFDSMYHRSFDGAICGPIVANPANPKES